MQEQHPAAHRMLIIANRLPFTAIEEEGDLTFTPSSGGLVTGLVAYLEKHASANGQRSEAGNQGSDGQDPSSKTQSSKSDFLWIGWPGGAINDPDKQQKLKEKAAGFKAHPVFISEEEMDKFYYGFCNSTVWPLFHYFPRITYYDEEYWKVYRQVNERYAEAVMEVIRPGDRMWVHDYQLMLLPAMIRERMPDVQMGFFLHIPFPGFELFRQMPRRWGRDILEGMLGADLIGFHTHDYTQYFLRSVMRVLGHDHHMGHIIVGDRIIKADTFPMGIDFDKFHDAVQTPEVREQIERLGRSLPDTKIILSIDRLDYTKGIINRLRGFEHFLRTRPEWHHRVVLTLVVIPSRIGVGQYRETKETIDETVGRINGKFGTLDWIPIRYYYTFVPFEQLVALYNTSHIALVTPLRDGMNLIAKEYVAASADNHGVLVLSEMAGAAKELGEAIIINPNSKEEIADALQQALEMPVDEQKRRNETMQKRLRRYNVVSWAEDFVRVLDGVCEERDRLKARLLKPSLRERMAEDYKRAGRRLLFLDYDGTLMPFARDPREVMPTERVLALLESLASDLKNEVVVISGRDRNTLEHWLGHLPLGLIAEHGVFIRYPGQEWTGIRPLNNDWKPSIRPVLEMYADRLPGAFVEEKEYSLVWHYRGADPELGMMRAQELLDHLVNFTANIDVQVLQGNKVIEVKTGGINKGTTGMFWLDRAHPITDTPSPPEFAIASSVGADFVLAIGDDWTDEYLFAALPESAYSIRVGLVYSRARFNLSDSSAVLDLLDHLVRAGSSDAPSRGELAVSR